jgi:hypothetical protein
MRNAPRAPAPKSDTSPESLARAEAHLRLLGDYFGLHGYTGMLAGGLILLSLLVGHPVTKHGSPWLTVPLLGLSSWAAFRTRRLLAERYREGVWMAAGTFACGLLAAASASELRSGAIYSALGGLLTFNVYRHWRALGF